MPESVWDDDVQQTLEEAYSAAADTSTREVRVEDTTVEIATPFPSPQDWRDQWIYFVMVDRFNNPDEAPRQHPHDVHTGVFQGGTIDGIRRQLGYLEELGVGAIWMTPVLKNCTYRDSFYGYGIQDFLQVDPRFASDPDDPDAELQALIDEAHARGIYIIFDVVLNHAGDVFAYVLDDGRRVNKADWKDTRYTVNWRTREGVPNGDWPNPPGDGDPGRHPDAAIWPVELQDNKHFRQQGAGGEHGGDFESLKELVTASEEVRKALIRTHKYLIAKYDVDGFRIDTLKYIEPDFARIFGNAVREYAQSIGKKNFFTFGEVYDDEHKISHFIGRHALDRGELTGVDAALDFPLFYKLPSVLKGMTPPSEIARVFEMRKEVQRGIISSHSEVSKFFVTFLDNHDQRHRFYHRQDGAPHRYDDQVTMGMACLFTLQGIPCLYYGTEQGLNGAGDTDQAVREALWGKPEAFDTDHPFYQALREIDACRDALPSLRYGRQYFRPLSGDGHTFGVSPFSPGVLAYSRVLSDHETVVAANANTEAAVSLDVVVDRSLHPEGSTFRVHYSNKSEATAPEAVEKVADHVTIHEVDGSISSGPAHAVRITLQPMEVQILAR